MQNTEKWSLCLTAYKNGLKTDQNLFCLRLENSDLKRELQEEKTRAVIFLVGTFKAQETKAKCEKWDCRWHPSTRILSKNENHHQSRKEKMADIVPAACLHPKNFTVSDCWEHCEHEQYWLHLCYPFPAVGGWVSSGLKEDVCSWWSKRRRRFTQSEGESGWLPAPLIEKRLHILYCRAAQRIKWRRRACKLGCGLRSGI